MNTKSVVLQTHVSFDTDGDPYVGSANIMTLAPDRLPSGRLTGYYGRNAYKKASPYLWSYFDKLGKTYSKVELSISTNGAALINQGIEDLTDGKIDVLNIPLAKVSLTDKLEEWSGDTSVVQKEGLTDRPIFRKISRNPELINRLFERDELKHINAIIWVAPDPDAPFAYITLMTLRDIHDISAVSYFNYDEETSDIKIRLAEK